MINDSIDRKYLDDFTCQVKMVYGNTGGFGSRSVSNCFGLNVYSGYRLSKFVRHTPRMGKSLISTSEYTRASWKLNTMPLVQKSLNLLTQHAVMFKYSSNRFHEKIIDECHKLSFVHYEIGKDSNRGLCRVSILTCGDKRCIGFFNEYHLDKNDTLEKNMVDILLKTFLDEKNLLESKSKHERMTTFRKQLVCVYHAIDYVKSFNIGLSTTCGYIFVHPNNVLVDSDVHAYFLLNDYSLAIRLEDGIYHNFNAYQFGHQTSFPVVKKNGRIYYQWDGFNILAWGAGGRKST